MLSYNGRRGLGYSKVEGQRALHNGEAPVEEGFRKE